MTHGNDGTCWSSYVRGPKSIVHPGELPAPEVPGIPTFTADFLLDTTRTATSLILSGAMDRYPDIKFILADAGGFVPYISYRILLTMLSQKNKAQQAWAILDQRHQVPKLMQVFKRFNYDIALSASPAALPSLLEVATTRERRREPLPHLPGPFVRD